MLCATLPYTLGAPKADRHPFNDRFVAMIEQVLNSEHRRLTNNVPAKEAAFAELSNSKTSREAALEAAKAVAAEKTAEADKAKAAVAEINATLKEAGVTLVEAKKAQKAGDKEIEAIAAKKAELEAAQNGPLATLVAPPEGLEDGAKAKNLASVMEVGKKYGFDTSLMSTAVQVFERDVAERGGFDATCLEQLKAAFTGAIGNFDAEIAAHGPAKAERASAVEQAEAAKQAAETSQAALKAAAAAANEAKTGALSAQRAATKSLNDFMPDLKAAGDGLDDAKKTVKNFEDGARTAFSELKDYKPEDFAPKPKVKPVEEAPAAAEEPAQAAAA